nr:SagB family peptide dehydrogenase [Ardenticatena sp.]
MQHMDVSHFWFVQPSDLETKVYHLYHERSKMGAFQVEFGAPDPKRTVQMRQLIHAVSGRRKRYEFGERFHLTPLSWEHLSLSLGEVLRRRRSRRSFVSDSFLPQEYLATWLIRSAGLNGTLQQDDGSERPLRLYPSGGALYPLELYPLLWRVRGIPPGLYHFDPYEPDLTLLNADVSHEQVCTMFLNDPMLANAIGVVFITALFPRTVFKYGERGYRFVLLEAGHLMQNILLVAEALGISTVPMGGYLDRAIEALLDIDGVEESVVYAVVFGHVEDRGYERS